MIDRLPPRAAGDGGFTLVEMLISLLVLGVFVAMFSLVVTSAMRHSGNIQEQTVLQVEARSAADVAAADLRQASAGAICTSPIELATPTALQFLSPTGSQPIHERRVALQLSAGVLQRASTTSTNAASPWTGFAWTTPPASGWAKQVGSLIANPATSLYPSGTPLFSYYGSTGAELTPPTPGAPLSAANQALITAVGVTLTVRARGSSSSATYGTRATFRVGSSC